MPSTSRKQQKLMHAAAGKKGGAGGVSQKVGKEFATADHERGKKKLPMKKGKRG